MHYYHTIWITSDSYCVIIAHIVTTQYTQILLLWHNMLKYCYHTICSNATIITHAQGAKITTPMILVKLESNGTFKHQQAERERQARTGRNQSLVHDVCKKTLACSTLGSSAAMLNSSPWTMVKSVKMDHGEECANIDKKRCRAPSRQSEQTTSWARYMEIRSTSLNSLMETKWYYKNWCLWKECHTPHLMVITTTVICE